MLAENDCVKSVF